MASVMANITEIFSSLQGEGPHTGEPMTFVRFAGCALNCRWCDTEAAIKTDPTCRVETPPRSARFVEIQNPVSIKELNGQLAFFTDPAISITGGEPLEQVSFLEKWLPTVPEGKRILLETNGILHRELDLISKRIDIVSMDIKLPSSTGKRPCWDEHAKFISDSLRSGKEFYIKIVITSDTSTKDIQEAIKLISSSNRFIPVILQPASFTPRFTQGISSDAVESFARLCNSWLPNVTIMKQAHKELGIL